MQSYIFKEKLKKLNASLYLKEDNAIARTNDVRATGIYSRVARRAADNTDYTQLTVEGRAWLSAKDAGQMDTFITGCPTGWIPEYDVFEVESGRILQKGWRTIVLYLVKERFTTLDKARNTFSRSLGESDFDKAGYDGKLAIARKASKWKSAREQLGALI
jgi:hypothetical protein